MLGVRLYIPPILMIFSVANAAVSFIAPPSGGETVTFPENKPPGTTIYALQANDPAGNSPSFSTHSARCGSTDVTPFPISNTDALLVPAWGLDAENCSMFTFQFRVVAGDSSATSDSLTVIVTNINDNPPQFNETTRTYYGEVWKNRIDEYCVNKKLITAFDPDNLHNITLAIAGAQKTFAVNNSGCVYVKSSSGLESLASPTILTIQASDGGLTSTATLNITVHEDPCKNSPCQNGGTCNSDGTDYSCICLSGYSDRLCDKVDYCFIKPCQHNGSCNNTENGYICNCLYPYANKDTSNKNCTVLDYCEPNPCKNGGTCINDTDRHSCTCPKQFTGTNCKIPTPNGNETKDKDNNSKNKPNQPQSCQCEHGGSCLSLGIGHVCVYAPDPSSATCTFHYDPCKAAPCQNNGTCSQNNGTYSCSCLGSYVGKHCESVNYCDHDNCRHGSTCINLPHSYLCSCRPGNVGEHCTDVDYCHQTHCQHGGTCVNLPNGYMCNYLSTTHEANTTFHLSPVG